LCRIAVEAFDVTVLHRLAGADEVQMHIVFVIPEVHRLTRELGPIVDGDPNVRRRKFQSLKKRLGPSPERSRPLELTRRDPRTLCEAERGVT
jgi:hypothetical protein